MNTPLTGRPASGGAGKEKTGRASEEYRTNFWNAMRSKVPLPGVVNALEEGTDSEGGYLVPDEYERTLVEALEEENVFRQLANVIRTSSGDRKIPVVATKGTASWIDEEGAYTESDDSFGQVSIGAYKVGTMIKVSEELSMTASLTWNPISRRNLPAGSGRRRKRPSLPGTAPGSLWVCWQPPAGRRPG